MPTMPRRAVAATHGPNLYAPDREPRHRRACVRCASCRIIRAEVPR